jgi:signal recognition particle subunit SRP19
MSHARIEEVSDSDPEIEDPTDFLPDSSQHAIQPASVPFTTSSASSSQAPVNPTLFRPPPPGPQIPHEEARQQIKTHCSIYPIYFDARRTRAEGRRVTKSLAVDNPLAWNILTAIREILTLDKSRIRLPLSIEPEKTHPKDWANPGRVRVQLFDTDTHKPLHPAFKNKASLYRVIGQFLVANPTEKDDPLDMKLAGLPIPENFMETEVPKPRGWKMGEILPVHSCAVSGGGVSDNFFKEAMEEMKNMQGQGGMPGLPGGGGGGMPDMSALQSMMGGMGMGGPSGGGSSGGSKKKDKKKG